MAAKLEMLSLYRLLCDKCDFTCLENSPSTLKRHIEAVHERKHKYPCHLCTFFSFRKDRTQNHINFVHLKHRPYQCDKCDDMGFVYKRDLLKHMAKVHGS